jgi:hypothetical protein
MEKNLLGLGITHYPGLSIQGNLSRRIKICTSDPALPEHLRSIDKLAGADATAVGNGRW